ncbi:MAG: hypothetical protein WBP22_02090 [Candidatus Saccharimonas sp.]
MILLIVATIALILLFFRAVGIAGQQSDADSEEAYLSGFTAADPEKMVNG